MLVSLLIFKSSKNSANLTILLSCNYKGLIVDCYLNRKREISVCCGVHLLVTSKISARVSLVTLLGWSHNFAGYVINTAWLEDTGCRKHFYKFNCWLALGSFAFESLFFNGSHRLTLFVWVRKYPVTSSWYHYWPIISSTLYIISFFKFGIMLQQPITSERLIWLLFEYVLHHPEGNERTWDFQLYRCHISYRPHSTQTRWRKKIAAFWCYFWDFGGAQKDRELNQISKVFRTNISDH